MAPSSSVLSLSLLLLLVHGSFAQVLQQPWQWQGQQGPRGLGQSQQRHPLRFRSECRLENLNVLEPSRRIEAEAGVTEIWDENEEQFVCAGSAFLRHVIRRNGLFLPSYTNAPELLYVVQGRGLQGVTIPGCPETYQSDESESFRGQGRERGPEGKADRHQKVREIREGDVLALPAGISHWIYNQGQSELVLVSILYSSNEQNQLDQNVRKFFLAGNPQQGYQGGRRQHHRGGQSIRGGGAQQGENFGNIFQGFDDELIAESFNIEPELARKLRSEDDRRGHIVEAREELRIIHPQFEEGGRHEGWEERERERERGRERRFTPRGRGSRGSPNGLEETLCTLRLRENIDNPDRADFYNPRGGRITSLNSFSLPILSFLQLSAERGVLYRDAVVAPHYYMNSHAVIYVTRGNARIQIAGDEGRTVFDGEVRENQVLVVPQNFVVIKKAGSEGFEWVAFRTNDNAMVTPLAGRLSVFRGLPEDVLVNAYGISRQEARRLKYNRDELAVFSPGSGSGSRSQQGRRD